jgi:hypothetical protein
MNPFSLAALLVLVSGLLGGGAIYFTAGDPEPDAYIIVGDTAYAYDPTTSKTYVREIERFGGKAALLFDDFNRWFASLWRGKALGITIAWISAAAALLLYWIAKARGDGPS